MRRLMKTGTYCMIHITVATMVAYLLSGNWHVALGIGLIEPLVQTGVFYFHETLWEGTPKPSRVQVA